MPNGPGRAVVLEERATCELTEEPKKSFGRTRFAKVAAKARADALSKEERSAIAEKAAARRWK